MAQFVAFDPHVEVNGTTVRAVTAGLGEAAIPILAAHGLSIIESEGWYSQQAWLDSFRDISKSTVNAMFDLVGIGMAIPENAIFPPAIDSIESALKSIDVAYHMNHRGGEIGEYRVAGINAQQIDMVCRNPYPCDFDYGIIYGMARRFCPQGMFARVYHDNQAACRKNGADSCTYHIVWESA